MRLHVVGDSVPAGYGLDDPADAAWPARLSEFVPELTRGDVNVDVSTGRTVRDCATRLTADRLAERFGSGDSDAGLGEHADDASRVVLVHAGHDFLAQCAGAWLTG